jgi:crotonobetainyl-CoA:carnitine CoA-transferase CaiB-like acyl-CoA transferase
MAEEAGSSGQALEGLRVLDLTSVFMGPYCTLLLAQWGADVVKVESGRGDVVRYINDVNETGMGSVFLATNRGKRSIVVDLSHPRADEVMTPLIEWCDVLVHNIRPAAARRARLDHGSVLARNPRCVSVAFRGFAADGPAADDRAYDDIIQARSGLAAVQGGASTPAYVRSSIADKIVGAFGAAALLAAVRQRDATGVGVALDVPMLETMVGFNLLEQQGGLIFDPPRGPSGYSRTSSEFRRPYRTKDGTIAVMVYTDDQWRAFFSIIGRDELARDERFATIGSRTHHSDELYKMVNDAVAERTSAEWLDLLGSSGIPVGPVNTVDELLTDPQLAQSGFFRHVDHPTEGALVLPMMTGPTDDSPNRWFAPRLGADSAHILRELGFHDEAYADLARSGVLGQSS